MRNTLKTDDIPVLAAWLLWELFLEEEGKAQDGGVSDGEGSGKRTPRPPRPSRSSKT